MKKALPLLALASTLLITLSACTGGNTTQPTPAPTTAAPQPSITSDPNKYAFAAANGPDTVFGLQLLDKTKFADQKITNGLLNEIYGNCGVVFVNRKIITADHLLSTAEQIQQSDNWINEYAKKVGTQPDTISNSTINTTEPAPGGNNYAVETRQATFASSKYNGILESRVFPDGTGLALAFLCSTGVTVPDVPVTAKVTTKPAPAPTPSATVSTAPTDIPTPGVTSTAGN